MSLTYFKRKKYGEELEASYIFNMDETPIYLESISKKAIAPIGAKIINIRTNGSYKRKIIKSIEIYKNKKIFIVYQENSWADKQIFSKWLEYSNNTFVKKDSNYIKKFLKRKKL